MSQLHGAPLAERQATTLARHTIRHPPNDRTQSMEELVVALGGGAVVGNH